MEESPLLNIHSHARFYLQSNKRKSVLSQEESPEINFKDLNKSLVIIRWHFTFNQTLAMCSLAQIYFYSNFNRGKKLQGKNHHKLAIFICFHLHQFQLLPIYGAQIKIQSLIIYFVVILDYNHSTKNIMNSQGFMCFGCFIKFAVQKDLNAHMMVCSKFRRHDTHQKGEEPQKKREAKSTSQKEKNSTYIENSNSQEEINDGSVGDSNGKYSKAFQQLPQDEFKFEALKLGWFQSEPPKGRFYCVWCDKHYLTKDQVKRHIRVKHQIRSQPVNNGNSYCPYPKCGARLWGTQVKQHLLQQHNIDSEQDLRLLKPLFKMEQCLFCPKLVQIRYMKDHFSLYHKLVLSDGDTLEKIKQELKQYGQSQTVAINRSHHIQLEYLHKKIYGKIKRFPKENKELIVSGLSPKQFQMIPEIYELDDEQPQILHGIVVMKLIFDIHQKLPFKIIDVLFRQIYKPADVMGKKFELKCGIGGILRMLVQKEFIEVKTQNDVRQMVFDEEGNKKFISLRSQRYSPSPKLYRIYFELILNPGFDSYSERYAQISEQLIQKYKRQVSSAQVGMKPQFKDQILHDGSKLISTQNLSVKKWFLNKKLEQESQKGGQFSKYVKEKLWIKTPRETQLFLSIFKSKKQIQYLRAELQQSTSKQQSESHQRSKENWFEEVPRGLQKTISLSELLKVHPGEKYTGKRSTFEEMQQQRIKKMEPEELEYQTHPNRLSALQRERLKIIFKKADPKMTMELIKFRNPQHEQGKYLLSQQNSDIIHGLTWLKSEKKPQVFDYKAPQPTMLPVYGTQESDIRTPIKQKKRKEEKYEFKITNDEKQLIENEALKKAMAQNQAQLNELLNLYQWKNSESQKKKEN